MSPQLVIWAIRALLRLGQVTANAREQKIRDRDLLLPSARSAGFSVEAWLQQVFLAPANSALVAPSGALHRYWDGVRPRRQPPESMERLVAAALELEARQTGRAGPVPKSVLDQNVAYLIVSQWAEEAEPAHPYARVVLTLADIALEYVGMNPGALGIGGNGEKLVQAIAANLTAIIPDDADPERLGRQRRLGERLAAAFFRGGLQAVAAHPEYAFADEHLRALVARTIPPIVAALPAGENGLEFEVSWSEVADALLGPAAMAALDVLTERQRDVAGGRLDPGTAVGAVTRAVLESARADGDLRRTLTDAGVLRAFRAIAGVAAATPELFIGGGGDGGEAIARDLLGSVAKVVAEARSPLSRDLVVGVAAAGLDSVGRNAGSVIRLHPDWNQTAVRLVRQVLDGLRGVLAGGAPPLDRMFAGDQLVQLTRIVLEEIARNPAMVGLGSAPDDDPRHRVAGGIVATIATAMAQDRNRLLSADDWLAIVGVVAREVARNPDRLFRLDVKEPGEQLAAQLIGHVLAAAAAGFSDGRPKDGALLYATTLREMVVLALRFGAEHAAVAAARGPVIRDLATRVEALARKAGPAIGAGQVVALFAQALPRVLGERPVIAGPGDLDAVVTLVEQQKLAEAVAGLVR